jgi:integrase
MTNEQLLTEYSAELKVKLAAAQFPQYMRTLNDFFNFCGGLPPTRHLVIAYLNKFQNRSQATRRRYYNIIKGLFISPSGLADRDFNIDMPNPKPLPQAVTDDAFYKLIDSMDLRRSFRNDIPRDKLLVLFLGRTGLRREEAAELKISDIQLGDKPQVMVRGGKGEKDRAVPILLELLKPLSEFIEPKGANESVFGLTKEAITDKISRYAKKIGLHLHPHSLRHYCAGWLLRNGFTAKEVQEWLGHERLDTTGRYLDLVPDALHDAVKRNTGKKEIGSNPERIAHTIQELELLVVHVGVFQIDTISLLKTSWGKFSSGLTLPDFLTILNNGFASGSMDFKLLPDAADLILENLSLHQIIRQEQRRRGTVRDKIDVDYWVLTDYGKEVVLSLKRTEKESGEVP